MQSIEILDDGTSIPAQIVQSFIGIIVVTKPNNCFLLESRFQFMNINEWREEFPELDATQLAFLWWILKNGFPDKSVTKINVRDLRLELMAQITYD